MAAFLWNCGSIPHALFLCKENKQACSGLSFSLPPSLITNPHIPTYFILHRQKGRINILGHFYSKVQLYFSWPMLMLDRIIYDNFWGRVGSDRSWFSKDPKVLGTRSTIFHGGIQLGKHLFSLQKIVWVDSQKNNYWSNGL